MFAIVSVVLLVFGVVAALAIVAEVAVAYYERRGTRVITCPATAAAAAVDLDPRHALVPAAFQQQPDLRVRGCSEWPGREGCEQACLSQVRAAPEATRVDTMLSRWFERRTCVGCHRPIRSLTPRRLPGLITDTNEVISLREIAPERIVGILARSQPLCRQCLTVGAAAR